MTGHNRKYQCPNCNYATDNRSHLRRHESSVHYGAKLYECFVCHQEFARSEKCRAHVTKEHPGVVYDPRLIRKDRYFGSPDKASLVLRNESLLKPQILKLAKGAPHVVTVNKDGSFQNTEDAQVVKPEVIEPDNSAFSNTSMS